MKLIHALAESDACRTVAVIGRLPTESDESVERASMLVEKLREMDGFSRQEIDVNGPNGPATNSSNNRVIPAQYLRHD